MWVNRDGLLKLILRHIYARKKKESNFFLNCGFFSEENGICPIQVSQKPKTGLAKLGKKIKTFL